MAMLKWLEKLEKHLKTEHAKTKARYYYQPNTNDRKAIAAWLRKSPEWHLAESERLCNELIELEHDIQELGYIIWPYRTKAKKQ